MPLCKHGGLSDEKGKGWEHPMYDEDYYKRKLKNAKAKNAVNNKCHDCHVRPGQLHKEGCDSPTCTICGMQLLQCGHWKTGNSVHTGIENQDILVLCEALGLFTKWVVDGEWPDSPGLERGHYERCGRDDPNATYDLNTGHEIRDIALDAVRRRRQPRR